MAECVPEDHGSCSICLNTYSKPKLLQCFHVYCQDCLFSLVDKNQELVCPACRQTTPLPSTGVEGLQEAFHIAGHHMREGGEDEALRFCPVHEQEECQMFCETCGVLVCSECVSPDGKHHGHDYDSVSKAYERYKEEITSSIGPMEQKLMAMKKTLENLVASCSSITEQESTVEASISGAMAQIRMVLKAREAELLEQVQQVSDAKLRELSAQREELVSTQTQLNGALDFMRESGEGNSEGGRLMMRTTTSLHPKDLVPSVEADIQFEASPDITAACENFGELTIKEGGPRRKSGGKRAKAVRDYTACNKNEISLVTGSIIENVEQVDDKWWSGECEGRCGLFPSENVELMTTL